MVRPIPVVISVALLCGTAPTFGQTLTTLYDFGGVRRDGEYPQPGVVFDQKGNLWGTATLGGDPDGGGTIFELIPPVGGGTPWTEVTIHRFHGAPDGETPESRLTIAPSGVLYGTTYLGGENDLGAAFQAVPPRTPGNPWNVRIIHSFGGAPGDGMNPNSSLLAADGVLYGVTQSGGSMGGGTVYSLTPPSEPRGPWTESVLYRFRDLPDAIIPSGDLARDAEGNLYGNALLGGANNLGAVFRLSPPAVPGGRWRETVIHSFNGDDGTLPAGALLVDGNGVIYGTTVGGGDQPGGTVFALTPPAIPGEPWTHAVLYNFSGGRDGGGPESGVIMDQEGQLFGTTSSGGDGFPNSGGVVFVLSPPGEPGGAWTETVLHSFGGNDGFRPSRLVLRDDALYGTTAQGGAFTEGTAFELTIP